MADFKPTYHNNFAGGVNRFLGPRQVKENESPDSTNCDFKGKTGVGNRQGYTQLGTVLNSRTKIYGLDTFSSASAKQLIKWASNGSNIALGYSTGGSWTDVTTSTFTDATNMDCTQAGGKLYTWNGVDNQYYWDGTSLTANTGVGTKGLYGAYFDKRHWCVDPTSLDTLKFSTQFGDATKPLDFVSSGTSSDKGTVTILPGSGAEIRGMKPFKNALYVFLFPYGIYRIKTTSTINVFSVELITNAVGCVSHRSIDQVGEDLYFAADDGIYSLGDVANFLEVRSTNKSARIQQVFDALSGASKARLAGRYFNFKYHLFYPLYGGLNDSCAVYDTRYQGWQDWRNIAANDATTFTDSSGLTKFYFGEPSTGKVHQLYLGRTDNGTLITSTWYSKSYDEDLSDVVKLFYDTTFTFGSLTGSLTAAVIFDDSEIQTPVTITQSVPQGGFGRDAFGRKAFGDATNTVTVTQVVNKPQRLKAKGQKFAVQYRIASTGDWRLDSISQLRSLFGHFKFPSSQKLN